MSKRCASAYLCLKYSIVFIRLDAVHKRWEEVIKYRINSMANYLLSLINIGASKIPSCGEGKNSIIALRQKEMPLKLTESNQCVLHRKEALTQPLLLSHTEGFT